MHLSPALATTLLLALPSVGLTAPVEQTPYGLAALRLEARPSPPAFPDVAAVWNRERELAAAGVGARWIQMVDNEGSPFLRNDFLPCPYPDAEAYEATLKQWVREIHAAGMPALSWYPLIFCRAATKEHPDWRQVSLIPWVQEAEHGLPCCPNSGYGDALVGYCVDAIGRLGLDGIWFDGSVLSLIWQRPCPLTCVCAHCQARFRQDTGLDLPTSADWTSPVFRRWVRWRYEIFGATIGRLAKGIRERHPNAAVVINHYHRPGIPWHSAIPLDRYEADIISGSEAFSPESLDLTMRLCRAYGRPQSEVWRQFDTEGAPEVNAERLLHHALTCFAAGGFPAFGGDMFNPRAVPTAALLAPPLKAIQPFVGGPVLPHVALHVSQQTETFVFGRINTLSQAVDPFFESLGLWTAAFGQAHLPPDYVYDADFGPERLAAYKVLLLPLSLALTAAQARTAVEFARQGGVLVVGVGAGQCDAEGEPQTTNPLAARLGLRFGGQRQADGADSTDLTLIPVGAGAPLQVRGPCLPLAFQDPGAWQPLYREGERTLLAQRSLGAGQVLVLGTDAAYSFGSQPVAGGNTRLEVTDETAAAGRWSLRFVDDPAAPESFYPDLETRTAPFGQPEWVGGELNCDLRVGARAQVSIEVRCRSHQAVHGPCVAIRDGHVTAGSQPLGAVPLDQWFHLRIVYRFASDGKPADYEATVTLPDGTTQQASAICPQPEYCRTDWFVIYGAGQEPATFYLDGLRLERVAADGRRGTVTALDFEAGPATFGEPTGLAQAIAARSAALAPPPVTVTAPPNVRVGVFRRADGGVLVHLHDWHARRDDWLQARGAAVSLRCAFPLARARLVLAAHELPVHDGNSVDIPALGVYQVVELTPAAEP
jgi:hypothetical protein